MGANLPPGSTTPRVGSPLMMAQTAMRPSGSSANERALSDHMGMPNSASIGASGCEGASVPGVEVAPARLVPDENQDAVLPPLRLEGGAEVAASARHELGLAGFAGGVEFGHVERGRLPGHVGEVPGQPGEPSAVGRNPGAGVKVASGDQRTRGAARASCQDR